MAPILIRREKKEVFDQLPNVVQKNIFVELSDEQARMHGSFKSGIAQILRKKFKTTYDWQKIMLLLTNMRMVCNSTFLIDKQTHFSPKLIELKHILTERLNIKTSNRKIIIFSEWITMLNIIGDMLKEDNITFTKLTGKVPVKKRHFLIKEFEDNQDCKVFLSSESGGSGLNLQVADTVINFELPWNPAKKNQRIGRIDRIGQKRQKLHVFNLLSYGSIEMQIATGILLKQNLFEGVLNESNLTDEVDFSEKGKSQFIKQVEEVIKEDNYPTIEEEGEEERLEEENLKEGVVVEEGVVEEEERLEEEDIIVDSEKIEVLTEEPNQEVETLEPSVKLKSEKQPTENPQATTQYEQMEEVMTKGMEFLTGLYQMSTGQKADAQNKPKVRVNKETGEVSISFKMEI